MDKFITEKSYQLLTKYFSQNIIRDAIKRSDCRLPGIDNILANINVRKFTYLPNIDEIVSKCKTSINFLPEINLPEISDFYYQNDEDVSDDTVEDIRDISYSLNDKEITFLKYITSMVCRPTSYTNGTETDIFLFDSDLYWQIINSAKLKYSFQGYLNDIFITYSLITRYITNSNLETKSARKLVS